MPPKRATRKKESTDGDSRIRPFWSGTLTFGLVSVPVNLFPANQASRAPLRMLSPEGEPLARKYYSEKTERDLDADEMVRGYEVDNGKYVVATDEELEHLAPEKTRDIDLTRFVKEDSIHHSILSAVISSLPLQIQKRHISCWWKPWKRPPKLESQPS
ncbi:MAG: hypothetical protein H0U18_09055 [Pyrinomonadaceae bacterium]|nr:hypothetical protein [Pyrinomonadaceae bacterium]